MDHHGELEIWLQRPLQDQYTVLLRFKSKESEDERVSDPVAVKLDMAQLLPYGLKYREYGAQLDHIFFSDAKIREVLDEALGLPAKGQPLQVRLFIGSDASELHDLRWETLADSRHSAELLLTRDLIHFSRYLSSKKWRDVMLHPKGELRALVAVASPTDPGKGLAPIDAGAVQQRFLDPLGDILSDQLTEPGQACLSNILDRLSEGVDILYLAAHGALVKGEPWLILVQPDGSRHRVESNKLASGIRDISSPPSLVVLASCQSAGTGEARVPTQEQIASGWGALSALGPQLCAAGVPAVLAMQGQISMDTEALFMERFFAELSQSGRVDQAMSRARSRVKERDDFWMPVLFTRLQRGLIWYSAGFSEDRGEGGKRMPALVDNVSRSRRAARKARKSQEMDPVPAGEREDICQFYYGGCTPILGPALLEPLVGRLEDTLSQYLDQKEHSFPISCGEGELLARMAQFSDLQLGRRQFHKALEEQLFNQLWRRYQQRISDEVADEAEERLEDGDPCLSRPLLEVAKSRRFEAHRVLANMELPIYLTANPDDLLAEFIKERGKNPMVEVFRWHDNITTGEVPGFDPLEDRWPTAERPLIFHLFGHLSNPRSLVLSEDDHFDFLSGFARNDRLIPEVVQGALANTALLFVGHGLEHWSFRVLLRTLTGPGGLDMGEDAVNHIAAQVDPEEGRLMDLAGTKDFLRDHFKSAKISIYWGTAEAFLADLDRTLQADQKRKQERRGLRERS